jgi:hypothetical protein
MKKYRLLKDLPYLKAGAIFVFDGYDTYKCDEETAQFTDGTKWDALGQFAVENAMDGWFEEIKEIKPLLIIVGTNGGQGWKDLFQFEAMPGKLPAIKQAIESILNNEQPKEEIKKKPPLGLKPDYIWKEERLQEIRDAMGRFNVAHNYSKECPQEWLDEKHELEKWISDRKYNGKRVDQMLCDEFGKTGSLNFSQPLSGTMVTLEECERREEAAFDGARYCHTWALFKGTFSPHYETFQDYKKSLQK